MKYVGPLNLANGTFSTYKILCKYKKYIKINTVLSDE